MWLFALTAVFLFPREVDSEPLDRPHNRAIMSTYDERQLPYVWNIIRPPVVGQGEEILLYGMSSKVDKQGQRFCLQGSINGNGWGVVGTMGLFGITETGLRGVSISKSGLQLRSYCDEEWGNRKNRGQDRVQITERAISIPETKGTSRQGSGNSTSYKGNNNDSNRTYFRELSYKYANKYGVDPVRMWKIVLCESGGRPDAKNPHSSATGIVQILLSAHPTITKEQALDPDFSLEWMAQNLAAGRWSMWVCKS